MIIVGLILSVFAIGFFCWLLFTLAVYALPLFVGITAAFAVYHHGSSAVGAIFVAILVGAATLAIGQLAFALVRSPLIRAAVALGFAAPAAVAGYYATLGLVHIGATSQSWCQAFAVVGAILTGGTAFARMALLVPPVSEQASAAAPQSQTFSAAGTSGH
jgi:hypothetical protein